MLNKKEALERNKAHIPITSGNYEYATHVRTRPFNRAQRLHKLWIHWERRHLEVIIKLCIHTCMQSNILEVETPRVFDTLNDKGRVHSHI